MIFAVLSALLSFSAVAFAGGGMDPNGCPAVRAGACGAAGVQIDPEGRPHAAGTSTGDQGSMIDPDGKPSR
jgi:hypothetical protein